MGATQRENTDHVYLRYGLLRPRKQRFPGTLSIPHCRYLTLVLINCKQAHPSGEITKQYYVSHFSPLCTALIIVNVLTLPKAGTIFRCTLFFSLVYLFVCLTTLLQSHTMARWRWIVTWERCDTGQQSPSSLVHKFAKYVGANSDFQSAKRFTWSNSYTKKATNVGRHLNKKF